MVSFSVTSMVSVVSAPEPSVPVAVTVMVCVFRPDS
ncbi:Uncharacterised protein [Vibrio cholerae]|nr:Uncharacterised protein [Vibrio cholerae]